MTNPIHRHSVFFWVLCLCLASCGNKKDKIAHSNYPAHNAIIEFLNQNELPTTNLLVVFNEFESEYTFKIWDCERCMGEAYLQEATVLEHNKYRLYVFDKPLSEWSSIPNCPFFIPDLYYQRIKATPNQQSWSFEPLNEELNSDEAIKITEDTVIMY